MINQMTFVNLLDISSDSNNSGLTTEQENALLDTPIRRYLSLNFFVEMMECQRLYVSRRKVFEDNNERNIPFHWAGFFTPVGDNIPPQPDKKQYWDKIRNEYSKWANMHTLCWTLTTQENYLMWKGYAGEDGVCIVSTIRKFIASIQENKDFQKSKCTIHCGQMLYNGFSTTDEENLPFWKGREFASENELRFYFEIKDGKYTDNHIFVPIDYSTLIDKVIISPFVRPRTANALCEMLKLRYDIMVSPSKIHIH